MSHSFCFSSIEKEPLVSVIMPCYNAESFIEKSVLSVIEPSFFDFCELIIVNDGSSDSSELLINRIIENNPQKRIRYISTENHGVSSARNTGLKNACGHYIAFVDSDDMYSSMFLENMYVNIEKNSVDVVFSLWTDKNDLLDTGDHIAVTLEKKDILDILLYRNRSIGLWSGLYRKAIIDGFNIRFDETIKYGEDIEFIWKFLLHSSTFNLIEAKLYFYRTSANSAMGKSTWEKVKVLDAAEIISNEVKNCFPAYYDTYNEYMFPRTVLSLQKDFAIAGNITFYQRLYEWKKALSYKKVLRYGKISVRLSALIYVTLPNLFFRFFRLYAKWRKVS